MQVTRILPGIGDPSDIMKRLLLCASVALLSLVALSPASPGFAAPADDASPTAAPRDHRSDHDVPEITDDDTEVSGDASADMQVFLMLGWSGVGSRLTIDVVVQNAGPDPSSGHTLVFAPQDGTDRVVSAQQDCTVRDDGGFTCQGGELDAGEMQTYRFTFEPPGDSEGWPPFWYATVTGNESDPNAESDRTTLELPDSEFVRIEPDIKTRVDDANDDGEASPGERIETYVHLENTSAYPWENVHVSVSGTVWDHRDLTRTIHPGEEATIKFVGVVPDLGVDASSGIEARVSARAVGATVDGWSGTLMLLGPYATPNPFGPFGEQYRPTDPGRSGPPFVDLDEQRATEERLRARPGPADAAPSADTRRETVPPIALAPDSPALEPADHDSDTRDERARSGTRTGQSHGVGSAPDGWLSEAPREAARGEPDVATQTFAAALMDDLRTMSPLSGFQSALIMQGLIAGVLVTIHFGIARTRSRRDREMDA